MTPSDRIRETLVADTPGRKAGPPSRQAEGVSLDDCARRAMMEVGLPKPDMSEEELAQFNAKQSAAIALARRTYEAANADVPPRGT